MRRQLCWTERLEDGIKREIRITFIGSKIKWQFLRSDSGIWDYDTKPTEEDWNNLQERAEAWYRRRRMPMRDLELVQKRAGFDNKRSRSA